MTKYFYFYSCLLCGIIDLILGIVVGLNIGFFAILPILVGAVLLKLAFRPLSISGYIALAFNIIVYILLLDLFFKNAAVLEFSPQDMQVGMYSFLIYGLAFLFWFLSLGMGIGSLFRSRSKSKDTSKVYFRKEEL
jgi:hypothetical protein